jgi:hypothetical protein
VLALAMGLVDTYAAVMQAAMINYGFVWTPIIALIAPITYMLTEYTKVLSETTPGKYFSLFW